MRLGILSDTHDELARTQQAVQMLRDAGAEALIHCGDLASPPIVEALAVLPAWFALGNHDSDMVPALQRAAIEFGPVCLGWGGVIEVSGRRVGVAHGHITTDVRRVLADQPEILLSGHSHIPNDAIVGGVRRINPGALHRADAFTVAVLDLASGELQMLRLV
ncbi:metallophosphoesterase family protein [Tuwongella immobilis]|uniref:Phosphoesterase n=1 Tax=Tuwongella immobilis TaxID=692036 RepID=A0A6C2YKZ0_9BACT|nr:metallophosphoesterase family protein [Tuwongella immobilis]VIP01783.1 Phosphodiesterase, MJ0936 family OS=Planctomyces limnophilus (strain ATCC 43296 / DSM 3776 / IFAM 1008 / 290) GN=Plim_1399 PE=4 SV=1: Metallophos_2 [Tuwongella immobilis]VTR99436.1 Phosphodiesterase, MJ0936 family OS=Planctomyces limnophilus (strain ATCC 43296 / DSM 3776 / IFAM 1008 / 290) GN=Plim_1399 PE=4 SV=1: Metallophos_2 [Tuwongella immobilis]